MKINQYILTVTTHNNQKQNVIQVNQNQLKYITEIITNLESTNSHYKLLKIHFYDISKNEFQPKWIYLKSKPKSNGSITIKFNSQQEFINYAIQNL